MGRWIGTGIIRNWFTQHRPRGAAVPFEAPALRMARVCEDERDGLIAILRDFANNGIDLYRAMDQPAADGVHDGP